MRDEIHALIEEHKKEIITNCGHLEDRDSYNDDINMIREAQRQLGALRALKMLAEKAG